MALESLEKVFAVNPFAKPIEIERKPEAIHEVEILKTQNIKYAFDQYSKIKKVFFFDDIKKRFKSLKDYPLSSSDINDVLQMIIQTTPEKKINDKITGAYISHLIQTSYELNEGNNFVLSTNDAIINGLGSLLKGTVDNPLRLTINGNVGTNFAYNSEDCIFNLNGKVDLQLRTVPARWYHPGSINNDIKCGIKSKYCIFNVEMQETYDKIKFLEYHNNSYGNLHGNLLINSFHRPLNKVNLI